MRDEESVPSVQTTEGSLSALLGRQDKYVLMAAGTGRRPDLVKDEGKGPGHGCYQRHAYSDDPDSFCAKPVVSAHAGAASRQHMCKGFTDQVYAQVHKRIRP